MLAGLALPVRPHGEGLQNSSGGWRLQRSWIIGYLARLTTDAGGKNAAATTPRPSGIAGPLGSTAAWNAGKLPSSEVRWMSRFLGACDLVYPQQPLLMAIRKEHTIVTNRL
jgi:hypothetical protein